MAGLFLPADVLVVFDRATQAVAAALDAGVVEFVYPAVLFVSLSRRSGGR